MLKNLSQKFIKEEEGGLFEYLILIAIAGLIAALLIPTLRSNLVSWFNNATDNITTAISGKKDTTATAPATSTKVTW